MHMSETIGSNNHAAPSFRNSLLDLGLERVFSLRSGRFFRLVRQFQSSPRLFLARRSFRARERRES